MMARVLTFSFLAAGVLAAAPALAVAQPVAIVGGRVHPVSGPVIEGAAYEIRFPTAPKVSMLDGYLTVDTGPWHFHLCVNDHRGAPTPEQARTRRVARAAFFRTDGGTCVPGAWGLRLWNGRDEQMVTVYFPNPWLDDDAERVRTPRWERTALWEDLRRRYAAAR